MPSDFQAVKRTLPELGVGMGYRSELVDETIDYKSRIDWLEIVPENYMNLGGRTRERLELALSGFPLVTHGVNLSIGSTDDLNYEYIDSLSALLELINAPWWSDHLCFSSVNGAYMHDLLPLPQNSSTVDHVARRIKEVQSRVGRPFLLENISYYTRMPGTRMDECQFLGEIIYKADCGLLLDVNNIYVNSINHGFDPYAYVDAIPLERTVQIHVAGHGYSDDMVIDTHGNPVCEPVYELLDYVLSKTTVNAVMLERDQNFPRFEELLKEVDRIRDIVAKRQPGLANRKDMPEAKVSGAANKLDQLRKSRRV